MAGDFHSVLIANRGEIAIRLARALAELELRSVTVFAEDDARSLHVTAGDASLPLKGAGARAYLDIEGLVAAAKAGQCQAVHPGYGFLSENASFARAVRAAGLAFIGPGPEALEAFGDKLRSRALARAAGVPLIDGLEGRASLGEVKAFFAGLPEGTAMMIKAAAGGGGRGMRVVRAEAEIEPAFAAAAREAKAAFGDDGLYAERLLERARHIEVQIAGDGRAIAVLGDRDCSLQRRRQKLAEMAPAPNLDPALRSALAEAARRLGEAAAYESLGTVEFLVESDGFAFIEANARLQVEHTVTEAVSGLDLVKLQIALAQGRTLAETGASAAPAARGVAIEARVNLETIEADGAVTPSGGVLSAYEPPSGPGTRVDGYGYAGYETSPAYDSLLAKVVVHAPSLAEAIRRAGRALAEFRIEGPQTNLAFLRALLRRPEVAGGEATTGFVDAHAAELAAAAAAIGPGPVHPAPAKAHAQRMESLPGATAVRAPLMATVGELRVGEGALVRPGQELALLEAMKMEHQVLAPEGGEVVRVAVAKGEVVAKGQPLFFIASDASIEAAPADQGAHDLDHVRPDLAEALERWRITRDEARPAAVEKRRRRGQRTARENIADLVDPGSFLEYGAFALAAQRRRRSVEDLMKSTPADGIVCGLAGVNGALFGPEQARCAALAYDFTVLAGTQGHMSHRKTDRLLEVVEREELPLVWYAEGGGGRPGDTESAGPTGLANHTFYAFARLAGLVPKIAVVSGRCFAGNAAIAGLSEILIATRDSNIGMGGPAMIEGGGLGVFAPEEIGPIEVQTANGVVDLAAEDEAEATRLAKQALSYFQGPVRDWSCADQRRLRQAIPENRLRVYDVRKLIALLADDGSFLELKRGFGPDVVTGFIRLEGRPMGLLANDPAHLGGAVDCDGAEKGARLLQLCDAFDLPVLSLIDTPGFMVGPDSEAQGAVRKTSRLYVNGALLGTPHFAVVLRKAYGLGAQAMAGGSTLKPNFCVAWPTGELGGMGLEGAIRLGYRRELDAEPDPKKREALYQSLVANLYANGKAIHVASMLEIDAVIDPADTRRWILQGLKSSQTRHRPRRRFVDAW
ncbi:MAG: carbamoyl-phosphate synthase large subunit [Caulobacteraceae bacterium]|nr:carbamoyl-phosphate synthase large subunit [Caulobacteraceae bacterium]